MNVMISGSHGLVGTALKDKLESEGHAVIRLPRTFSNDLSFKGVDAVIHLAGEGIATGRWNDEKKKRIKESRVGPTRQLSKLLSESPDKPAVFISASAIGFYGDHGDDPLTEESPPGTGYLSNVCAHWEEATRLAERAGIRTVHLRTGIVLSKKGGALSKMLTPFKLGAGGIIGHGRQYMSWISITDMVHAICTIIETAEITGPVNLTAPEPVTNSEFTKTLGQVLHRPTLFPMPAFAARLAFGEMADALLLSSARVLPDKLIKNGYQFKHADLKSALEDILK